MLALGVLGAAADLAFDLRPLIETAGSFMLAWYLITHYAALPQRRLPQTDAVAPRILTLPLFGHMTDEQLDFVTDRLVAAI